MGRGWVPPGYKYLGPGNDLDRGEPTNAADALAKKHDEAYDALLKAGAKPYTQWSDADKEFFSQLEINDIPTAVAKGLFGFKKGLHKVGIIGKASLGKRPASAHMAKDKRPKKHLRFNPLLPDTWGFGDGARDNDIASEEVVQPRQVPVIDRQPDPDDGGPMSLDDLLPTREAPPDHDPEANFDDDIRDWEMDNPMPPAGDPNDPPQAMARAGGGGNNPVSKETPISRYPTLTYGLQETHTTILPWEAYFSATKLDHTAPVVAELRLTQPFDCLKTSLTGLTAGSAWDKLLYNVPFNNANSRDGGTPATFPSTISSGTYTSERATWWGYWAKIYEYYTVLACHYEIYVQNDTSDRGTDALVGWDFNAYSTVAGASGNITPTDNLAVMKQYKQMNWRTAEAGAVADNDKRKVIIQGTYRPGQTKRNINNDGDVKTWTKTDDGGSPGTVTLQELLTLYFFRGELAWLLPANKLS